MANFQRVQIMGYLGADPDVRATANGMTVAKLRVGVSEKPGKNAQDQTEHTEWFRVTVFGATAENFVGPFMRKGQNVFIEGRLKTSTYEKDGETKYSTEMIANGGFGSVQIIGDNKGGGERSKAPTQGQGKAQGGGGQGGAPGGGGDGFEDDIPFDSHMKGCEYMA